MKYNHIMVDLETTGTNPVDNAVIQLAGVRFNLEHAEIDMTMFDQALAIPPGRYWSEDTREWWGMQDPHIIQGIYARMRDPATVVREFARWAVEGADGAEVVLWAKPSHFEYPFLESYFSSFGVAKPFHYRKVEDLNSWCRARGLPDLAHEINVQGDAHNALHDVLHQIQVLFTLMERTNVQVDPA